MLRGFKGPPYRLHLLSQLLIMLTCLIHLIRCCHPAPILMSTLFKPPSAGDDLLIILREPVLMSSNLFCINSFTSRMHRAYSQQSTGVQNSGNDPFSQHVMHHTAPTILITNIFKHPQRKPKCMHLLLKKKKIK